MLYKVVERNQTAFSFDSWLGHLPSKVHITLAPGTKLISMAPYYASPAKCEVIDRQLDLWLSQGVIEESKSPWGAPIVYRNDKLRVCIDWHKLNKAMVADQHPIPKQTDILQALSGAQYLSVFDTLSGFTQSQPSVPIAAYTISSICHLAGKMGLLNSKEQCRKFCHRTYGSSPSST